MTLCPHPPNHAHIQRSTHPPGTRRPHADAQEVVIACFFIAARLCNTLLAVHGVCKSGPTAKAPPQKGFPRSTVLYGTLYLQFISSTHVTTPRSVDTREGPPRHGNEAVLKEWGRWEDAYGLALRLYTCAVKSTVHGSSTGWPQLPHATACYAARPR